MTEKKVLIVTYYWPPSGGSGVQRWLKFVKYLPQFGVTPFVFTPENPSFEIKDPSLLKDVPAEAEVIHFPIWEPYSIFSRVSGLFGKKAGSGTAQFVSRKNTGLSQRVSTWIRGNLIIPDPRVFWVRPSVKVLHDLLKDNNIGTIITTGPPHSIHLIGLGLKKKNPSLKWIADFRDPWSEWGFLDSLMVGSIARRFHRYLESKVLRSADLVTTITPFYVRHFERLSGRKVELLTNGYDEDDFAALALQRTSKFVIRHVGIVNERCNPRPFMMALKEAIEENKELSAVVEVDFVGSVHPDFRDFVETDAVMKKITTFTPAVPHKELIELYNRSSLLLLILEGYKDAEGYMPGKLFEYLATGLPILGVGPSQGDAAQLMRQANAGEMMEGSNTEAIKTRILLDFNIWTNRSIKPSSNSIVTKYSRKSIASQLIALIY